MQACSELRTLEGLAHFRSVGETTSDSSFTGSLALQGNPLLQNLKGLERLVEVKGNLVIEGNPSLETLDPLVNLPGVENESLLLDYKKK